MDIYENNYKNPIENYDHRAISAWQVADLLKTELEGSDSLDNWHKYGEGYANLREAVQIAIERLRKIY